MSKTPRKPKKGNSLAEKFPGIAKEWNYEKNHPLIPEQISWGSELKVWWRCKNEHDWNTRVSIRTQGSKCPECPRRLRKVAKGKSIKDRFPNIAKEWDTVKNNEVTASEVYPGTIKKYWWLCSQGHSYEAPPNKRTSRKKPHGCPFCSGRRVSELNSLSSLKPDLVAEIHPEKNKSIEINTISWKSNKKLWWICKRGHEWKTSVTNRTSGTNCPLCNSSTSFNELRIYAELKKFFPDTKNRAKINGLEVDVYIPSLEIAIEYDGAYWHQDKKKKDSLKNKKLSKIGVFLIRIREKGLSKVSDHDFIYNFSSETIIKPIQYIIDNILVIYKASLSNNLISALIKYLEAESFINEDYFQQILDRLPSPEHIDSLDYKYPELSKEWDSELNGTLLPSDVTPCSGLKVYWKCSQGHTWKAIVGNRADKGTGCPYCAKQWILPENSLAFNFPDIAKEWHPTKNGELTPSESFSKTNKKVWWECSERHEWEASIYNRTHRDPKKKTGCPYCSGRKVTTETSLYTKRPDLVAEWSYEKNTDINPKEISISSNKSVWWKCSTCSHEWKVPPNWRSRGAGVCQKCKNKKHSLFEYNKDLLKYWKAELNSNIDKSEVSKTSREEFKWFCIKCENVWSEKPANLHRRKEPLCEVCNIKSKSIEIKSPHLLPYYDLKLNKGIKPSAVISSSKNKGLIALKCPHCEHTWSEKAFGVIRKKSWICRNCKTTL